MLVLNSILLIISIAGISLCLLVGKWSIEDRQWLKTIVISGLLVLYILLAFSVGKVEVFLK